MFNWFKKKKKQPKPLRDKPTQLTKQQTKMRQLAVLLTELESATLKALNDFPSPFAEIASVKDGQVIDVELIFADKKYASFAFADKSQIVNEIRGVFAVSGKPAELGAVAQLWAVCVGQVLRDVYGFNADQLNEFLGRMLEKAKEGRNG